MRLLASRPAIAAAIAASVSLVATPVLAAPASHSPSTPMAAALPHDVAQDRGWGSGGWGNSGWGGRGWGRNHHDGIDGGDVLAGVLILGTIAAVASAASKSKRDRDNNGVVTGRDIDGEYDGGYNGPRNNGRYGDVPPPSRGSDKGDWGRNRSIDGAVDTCVGEVERGSARVDTVDAVARDGQGWRVSGRTRGNEPFSCSVDAEGRVRDLNVSGAAPYRN